jgi:hypothetical protein
MQSGAATQVKETDQTVSCPKKVILRYPFDGSWEDPTCHQDVGLVKRTVLVLSWK